MNNDPSNGTGPEVPPGRPVMLTVLCILTFVGSGMNFISSIVIAGFFDIFVQIAADFAERFSLPGLEIMAQSSPGFFLFNALFYAGSVAGAALMLQLRKTGFHVYTVSQILLVLAPMLFLDLPGPGMFEMLLAGIFIFLYSRHLKLMA